MNFVACVAILAVIIGSSTSFRLESVEENNNINNDRIVGGAHAKRGQFPYQISLRSVHRVSHVTFYVHRCGGSIISDRWILSATHCTQGDHSDPSKLVIFAGAHHVRSDGKLYHLDRVVNHRDYNRHNHTDDICALRTKKAIEFNDFVQSIALRRQVVGAGVAAVVSGWGSLQVREMSSRLLLTMTLCYFSPNLLSISLFSTRARARKTPTIQHTCSTCA